MRERIDIHNYGHKLELVVEKMKEGGMLEANKRHILGFYNSLILRGVSASCL